ncbi:protein FAM151B isoform X1 [Polypterus senegalus]|uniref:protein FAM151B isoform X1 n=2 Tax=Polypterus senegalus TaxID=55291 RepID=UPI00196500E9|nr:protein FAM151B isoform X1 [Polypterus senegalus]
MESFQQADHSSCCTLNYFIRLKQIQEVDGAEIIWYHAANSRAKTVEALKGSAHMIEADILQDIKSNQPIMAHPPQNESDITFYDWLNEVLKSDKGIKLDFKSLEAVGPSIKLLELKKEYLNRPVWLNADILPGPGGTTSNVVDAQRFLEMVDSFIPGAVLSLGWTTSFSRDQDNYGYTWEMVKQMQELCKALQNTITFPVRAALLPASFLQLQWLLQQSERYTLTVWTGKDDLYSLDDLLQYRRHFDKEKIFYDISEAHRTIVKKTTGSSQSQS